MRIGYMTSAFGQWLLISKDPFPEDGSEWPFVSLRPGPPLSESLPLLAEIGYDEVTICTWVGMQAFPLSMSDRTKHEIKRLVDDLGLTITALGSHVGGNHVFDRHGYLTWDRDELIVRLHCTKLCIDLAATWGVSVVEDMVGQVPKGMSEEEAWSRATEVYSELTAYAEQRGVCLAPELIHGLIDSPDAFLRLHREVNSPALGCVLDMDNLIATGHPDSERAIAQLAPYLVHAHSKGVGRNGSTIPGAPDDTFDVRRFAELLVEAGYQGPLTLEEYPERYSPPLQAPVSARAAYGNVASLLRDAGLRGARGVAVTGRSPDLPEVG